MGPTEIGRRTTTQATTNPPTNTPLALLAFCGVLQALFSAIIFLVLSPDGSPVLRSFLETRNTVAAMGLLALATGACTIAAGLWNISQAGSWLLVFNGIACVALGLLLNLGATRPVTFRSIACLIAVMALGLCLYELANARTQPQRPAEKWLLAAAALVSFGFALGFLAFALRWFKLEPSPSAQTFNWLGCYFGFSAICMMGMALRPSTRRAYLHRIGNTALPIA